MKKQKKSTFFIMLALLCLLAPAAPASAFETVVYRPLRLEGSDRIATAIEVAHYGWEKDGAYRVVIVPANQENLIDSVAVAPLAAQFDAPILLTYKDKLDPRLKKEMQNWGTHTVYAVGGLSDSVIAELRGMAGVYVEVIRGRDRWETSRLLNARVSSPEGSFVVGYNSVAEALMISSFAGKNSYRVILADRNGAVDMSQIVGSRIYLMGDERTVAGVDAAKIPGSLVVRVGEFEKTVYDRNWEVLRMFNFDYDYVFVANGDSLVDALSVSSLAGRTGAPIVFANKYHVPAMEFGLFEGNLRMHLSKCVILGGPLVLDDQVMQDLTFVRDITRD
ncbi:MAG: cell wall-binding repeat-containing protein [Gracilibacteraceae bacterium]|jgi:putative cell wall-binding protein|nr:cell wall-binding repeat-containing protein [Gracilibacteraceae bacterium]